MAYQMSIQDSTGLSTERINRACPAIFADGKHESRSERYTYISTSELLDTLATSGFTPTQVMQSKSRIEGKTAFTKHLIRLRPTAELGTNRPDVREVVMVNAHDGTSSYQFMQGVFRIVCANGLIAGDIDKNIKVFHKGNVLEEVVNATMSVLEDTEATMKDVETMKRIPLERKFQLLLAEFAMAVRFDIPAEEEDSHVVESTLATSKPVLYQPADFLRLRRAEDASDDLYTVMNRVQENVLRGGIKRMDAHGQRHTTRPIHSIDTTVKTNRLLWQFTERMMHMLG